MRDQWNLVDWLIRDVHRGLGSLTHWLTRSARRRVCPDRGTSHLLAALESLRLLAAFKDRRSDKRCTSITIVHRVSGDFRFGSQDRQVSCAFTAASKGGVAILCHCEYHPLSGRPSQRAQPVYHGRRRFKNRLSACPSAYLSVIRLPN